MKAPASPSQQVAAVPTGRRFSRRFTFRPTVPIGTRVKVNHFHGVVVNVSTHVDHFDGRTGDVRFMALRNPIYEVWLDVSRRYRWGNALQVYIGPGQMRLKLFRDEFEILTGDERLLAESNVVLNRALARNYAEAV